MLPFAMLPCCHSFCFSRRVTGCRELVKAKEAEIDELRRKAEAEDARKARIAKRLAIKQNLVRAVAWLTVLVVLACGVASCHCRLVPLPRAAPGFAIVVAAICYCCSYRLGA